MTGGGLRVFPGLGLEESGIEFLLGFWEIKKSNLNQLKEMERGNEGKTGWEESWDREGCAE